MQRDKNMKDILKDYFERQKTIFPCSWVERIIMIKFSPNDA